MKAKVVAKVSGGVVVQVSDKHKDLYLKNSPFWRVGVEGDVGAVVEFRRSDILSCSTTQQQAERVLRDVNQDVGFGVDEVH